LELLSIFYAINVAFYLENKNVGKIKTSKNVKKRDKNKNIRRLFRYIYA